VDQKNNSYYFFSHGFMQNQQVEKEIKALGSCVTYGCYFFHKLKNRGFSFSFFFYWNWCSHSAICWFG